MNKMRWANSEISRLLGTSAVQVMKPKMGTYPQVFYVDLDVDIVGAKGST